MRETIKVTALITGISLPPFLALIVLSLFFCEAGDDVAVFGMVGFLVAAALEIGVWAVCRDSLSYEVKVRLWTHYVMSLLCCLLFILLCGACSSLAALGIALGAYFLVYYVLGVVQIPLNIRYAKEGYARFYRPFYPFLSRRRRQILLFPLNAGKKERFFFSGQGSEGCLEGDYLHMSEDLSRGGIFLDRYFLEAEAEDRPWTPDDQERAVGRMAALGARTVGFVRRAGKLRFLVLPAPERYQAAREELFRLFGPEVRPGRAADLGSLLRRVLGFDPSEGMYLPQASGQEQLNPGMSPVFPYDPVRSRVLCELSVFYGGPAAPDGLVPTVFSALFPDEEKGRSAVAPLEELGFVSAKSGPAQVLDRVDGELVEKESDGGIAEFVFFLPVYMRSGRTRGETDLATAFALYWRMRNREASSAWGRQRQRIEGLLAGLPEQGLDLGVFGEERLTVKELEDKGVFFSERTGWGCVDPSGAVGEAVELVRKGAKAEEGSVDQLERCVKEFFEICQKSSAFRVEWQILS